MSKNTNVSRHTIALRITEAIEYYRKHPGDDPTGMSELFNRGVVAGLEIARDIARDTRRGEKKSVFER